MIASAANDALDSDNACGYPWGALRREPDLRILVTNGATRLSQALAAELSSGHEARLTDRSQAAAGPDGMELVHSALGHDEATNRLVRGMDAIVHSGESDPSSTVSKRLDAATRCAYNLLWAATEERVRRVVFLSSLAVMAGYPENHTVTERWRPRPGTNTAALCYHLGEYVCREFGRAGRVDVVCLRLGDLVEKGQPAVSTAALYLDDAAQAVRRALELTGSEKEPVYREPVMRPTWSVFHVQSAVPNARYISKSAEEVLGYEPAARPRVKQDAPQGVSRAETM